MFPHPATRVVGLSIWGILELERRGKLPPNLMRYGIRGKLHIPGRGDVPILELDHDHPRSLREARPVGVDRYTQSAWEAVRGAARSAYQGVADAVTAEARRRDRRDGNDPDPEG